MLIRSATSADLPAIVEMGAAFWAMTAYAKVIPYDEESIRSWAGMMMEQDMLLVVEVDGVVVGSAGALLARALGNLHYWHGAEVWWYIRPAFRDAGVGIALMERLEESARDQGVVIFTMIALEAVEPDKAERLYLRSGYQLTERAYTKVLAWPSPPVLPPPA